MKGYLDNLRPSERRLVVVIGLVFFIVLNWMFVFPHFGDLKRAKDVAWEANRKLKVYQGKASLVPTLEEAIRKLQSEGNLDVPAEEQAHNFDTAITVQAGQSGIMITHSYPISSSTNSPFFLEQSKTISVEGKEQALVDFLYNLGSGNSLIRVRDLNIGPDPSHQKLSGSVKLVGSYQKTPKKGPGKASPTTASNTPGGNSPNLTSKKQ
jgi:hypothetical protein